MAASVDEGIRLYKQGKVHAASTLFEEVAKRAHTQGDALLEGRALGNLGTCCARRGDHEEAIKLYKQSLDLLGHDRRRAAPLLQYLERSYVAVGDVQGQEDVAARLAQMAFEEQEGEACFGDEERLEKEKGKGLGNGGQKMLSSLMGYFTGYGPGKVVDVSKEMEKMKELAGEQDVNDEHVLSHLSQVRFKDLPLGCVSRKVAASEEVNSGVERLAQVFSEVNFSVGSICQDFTVREDVARESPGSLRHALQGLDRHVQNLYVHAKTAQHKTIHDGIEPLELMRSSYKTAANGRLDTLKNADKVLARLEEEQRKQLEKLATRQERWAEAVREFSLNASGELHTKMERSRSRSNSADEETVEVLQGAVAEVKSVIAELNDKIEVASKRRQQLHEEVCSDVERLEQRRIDTVKKCLKQVLKAQIEALKAQEEELSKALEEVDKVDRSSDLRSYVNHELIKQSSQGDGQGGEKDRSVEAHVYHNEKIERAIESLFEVDRGKEERSEVELSSLCRMFEEEKDRACALRCLNRFRSKCTDVAENFDALTVVFIGLLDHAYIKADVKCAKMVLILAETFYHIEDGKKIYVQERIKAHAMWKAVAFWEEVFYQSVHEEIKRNWAVRQDGERGLPMSTFKNLVYGQIGSCAFSMMSCEVDRSLVRLFIDRMCIANGMHEQHRRDLMRSIDKSEGD